MKFFRTVRLLLLLLLLAGAAHAQQDTARTLTRVAHRGARALAPENTLAGIRKALEFDVDFIEIDVHMTRDSVVILHHDETVNRTTDGSGRIADMTWKEIAALDAGSWFADSFAGEPVPTLWEALTVVDGRCGLWIEIKGGKTDYPGLEKRIVEMIRQKEAHAWCQIISFDSHALARVHALDTGIVLQKLLVSNLNWLPLHMDKGLRGGSIARYDFVDAFGVYHKSANRRLIRKAHALGKRLNVWTVNKPERIAKLREMGVDGITTDDPALLTGKKRP